MAHALQLAEQGRYSTSPNPMVGCVIVQDNNIIAQGWHQQAGSAHAEVMAIAQAQVPLDKATLYVTLEPCCHHGRTPPCVDAIIAAKIPRVVIGCQDANPQVAGNGIAALKQAGVEVTLDVLQPECLQLNRAFFHAQQTGKPYVIGKWAMSIDGKIASKTGHSQWISNEKSRTLVHETRHRVDAIIVGAGTVIADDPQLTVRKTDATIPDQEQPLRIILDGQQNLASSLQVMQKHLPGETILASQLCDKPDYTIEAVLAALGKRDIRSVLIEGGAQVLTQCLQQHLLDEIHCYIAPKLIGGVNALTPFMGDGVSQVEHAEQFTLQQCQQQDNDVLLIYTKEEQHV